MVFSTWDRFTWIEGERHKTKSTGPDCHSSTALDSCAVLNADLAAANTCQRTEARAKQGE